MPLTDKEYNKFISISLKLRQMEGFLAELTDWLKEANEMIRELLLRKGDKDG